MDVRTRLEHLETLNAIAEVLNRVPFFRQAIHESLERVVEITGARAGWIFLARIEHGDVHHSTFRLAASCGLPAGLEADDCAALRQGSCECQGLFRRGGLDRSYNLVTCSRLEETAAAGGDTDGLTVHTSVPLQGSIGPVGVLNLAAPPEAGGVYDQATLALLTAVGRQMGTAYERAQAQVQRRTEAERVAALEERNRVARDIHDSATQLLFGAHLALRVAREGGDADRTTAAIDRGADLVEQAMGELRGLVELLRAADLEQGLAPALRRLAERIDGPVRVHLDADRHLDVPVEVADAAHRTVQEATHNALRHADAANIWLRVGREDDRLLVRIDDDGRGLPDPVEAGMGLSSIAERASALGGTSRFGLRPDGGARVEVELPWPR